MEIIEELETSRRGLYGGAVGYISDAGNMDMAIAIRTILLQGRMAHAQAGGGIVADSVPETEFEETQNKLAAVVAALRAAEKERSPLPLRPLPRGTSGLRRRERVRRSRG
jgi:anthranilate synthase component 1